jgi:hypothetical protein
VLHLKAPTEHLKAAAAEQKAPTMHLLGATMAQKSHRWFFLSNFAHY